MTSRYEDPEVLKECSRRKIRLIPKSLSGIVPIAVTGDAQAAPGDEKPPAALLLDDDPLVRMTWQMAARQKGIDLLAFETPQELLVACACLPRGIPIYIDSSLAGGIKGEDIAQELHRRGFTELRLQTGHPEQNFAHLAFLKAVQSKNPPW